MCSAVFPASYTFPTPTSVSGSSDDGNCANVSNSTSGTLTCADPTSSVLFDDPRELPILTGLDGDMWASQLLTIQTTATSTDITFDFRDTPNFVRVERVEVVMFNCLQQGIGVQTIHVIVMVENLPEIISNKNIAITTCDSFVKVCFPVRTSTPVIILRFFYFPNSDWAYLAELTFFGGSFTCPPDIVITAPTPSTITLSLPTPISTT